MRYREADTTFDLLLEAEDPPQGYEARILRLKPNLGYDASVTIPPGAAPPKGQDAEPATGGRRILHSRHDTLDQARHWADAIINRTREENEP